MYDKENKIKVDSIIPKDLESILTQSAKDNNRSRSQEICYIITRYFAHKGNVERGNADVQSMERNKGI